MRKEIKSPISLVMGSYANKNFSHGSQLQMHPLLSIVTCLACQIWTMNHEEVQGREERRRLDRERAIFCPLLSITDIFTCPRPNCNLPSLLPVLFHFRRCLINHLQRIICLSLNNAAILPSVYHVCLRFL